MGQMRMHNSRTSENKGQPVLCVEHLQLSFLQYDRGLRTRQLEPIRDLNLELYKGEILAIIGSSGSGKSLLAHAIMGILPYNASVSSRILFKGSELNEKRLKQVRGRELFLVPQSVTYLDPLLTVGKQIRISMDRNPSAAGKSGSVEELLAHYGLAPEVSNYYPHQLSGGMARKVLLVCALAADADVLIVDEPTPGLDEEALQEVLKDFHTLRADGRSVLMITHDIRAALQIADRVTVFYDGETVETALPEDFQNNGCGLRHPYSRKLIQALPRLRTSSLSDTGTVTEKENGLGRNHIVSRENAGNVYSKEDAPRIVIQNQTEPLIRLRAENIHFQYQNGREVLTGVNFEICSDEVVGLVAPSGAGKTTFARVLAGYRKPEHGKVLLEQYEEETGSWIQFREMNTTSEKKRPVEYAPVQMILQHPEKAVNPLRKMKNVLEEAGEPAPELLEEAGIRAEWLERWPGELSGGELQRFCLVRVLNERTRFLICDEMTTMLDAVSRAQLWELLCNYAQQHRIGVIIISHDRELVEQLCSRVIDLNKSQTHSNS